MPTIEYASACCNGCGHLGLVVPAWRRKGPMGVLSENHESVGKYATANAQSASSAGRRRIHHHIQGIGEHLRDVQARFAELRRMEKELERTIRSCVGGSSGDCAILGSLQQTSPRRSAPGAGAGVAAGERA